jgi:phytoene dehydrogenase-like protein
MLLARDGHDVTVLEKDPQGPPATALESWRDWQRTGVAQFRQAHAMHARFRHLLDAEFPDIRDDIVASGGRRVSIMSGFLNMLEDMLAPVELAQIGCDQDRLGAFRRNGLAGAFQIRLR